MSVRRGVGARLSTATLAVLLLAGCIPPFFPPFLPPFGFGQQTLVVENVTETDWVLAVDADFPTSFAIPAGETGEIMLFAGAATSVSLQDIECADVTELAWDDEFIGVRITEGPSLEGLEERPGDDLTTFSEFFECGGFGGGTPEAGAPLPGGLGTILVVGGDGSSWTLDVATAELTSVAEADGSFGGEFALSADGSQIAFSQISMTNGATSLHLMNADGTDARLLLEDASTPVWSPDGTRLAYVNVDPFAGGSVLGVLDIDSGETVDIGAEAMWAAWSPDSSRLAFVGGDFDTMDPFAEITAELQVVNADGTGLETLADSAPFASAPAWSPDGSSIAFMSVADDAGSGSFTQASVISLIDLETDEVRILAELDDAALSEPVWSPDGGRLAFTVSTATMFSSGASIGIVPASGGEIEIIGELEDAWYVYPLWSPDGAWIAASRTSMSSLDSELVAFSLDGADEVVLATGILSASGWR